MNKNNNKKCGVSTINTDKIIMKNILLFLSIFCFTAFTQNSLFAQYSNATLNGPWFMDTIPAQIYSTDNTNYLVFDGNGHITDFSGFGSMTGNYAVTTGGVVSGALTDGTDTYPFSGQLSSQNFGNLTTLMGSSCNFGLSRIANLGLLTDSLVGVLYSDSCGQKNIVLRLNNQGQIISASGLTQPVTGRVYADQGHFEGHIKTGDNSLCTNGTNGGSWDEFTIVGAYINDSLTGKFGIDGPSAEYGGTVHLKRFGTATGIVPLAISASKLIVYPNPASDIVTFNINNANTDIVELNIYTVMGLLVRSEILKQNHMQINIGDLCNGVYMVTIKSKDLSENQRLIIQR